MKKTIFLATLVLGGISAAQAVVIIPVPPGIEIAKVRANGSILVGADGEFYRPGCHESQWGFVVPADADPLLKQAVIDAAARSDYVELQGAGNCQGNIEILKSVTRSNPPT